MWDWRIPARKKPLVALRMTYRGGYSVFFDRSVKALLKKGYTQDELLDAAVDDTMRKWIDNAIAQK